MKKSAHAIRAHCTHDGCSLNVTFAASEIVGRFQRELEKQLAQKGASISWQDAADGSQLFVRFTLIDQGNQFLRWLLPMISPAKVHLEGEFTADGKPARPFHHADSANFGIAGGAARDMLGACADRLAKVVAEGVARDLA